ncbi:MAG: hypothetical protein AAFV90_24020 [Cyanobacteria bacterium J06634_5]
MMANSPNNSKQTTQPQQMPDRGLIKEKHGIWKGRKGVREKERKRKESSSAIFLKFTLHLFWSFLTNQTKAVVFHYVKKQAIQALEALVNAMIKELTFNNICNGTPRNRGIKVVCSRHLMCTSFVLSGLSLVSCLTLLVV